MKPEEIEERALMLCAQLDGCNLYDIHLIIGAALLAVLYRTQMELKTAKDFGKALSHAYAMAIEQIYSARTDEE